MKNYNLFSALHSETVEQAARARKLGADKEIIDSLVKKIGTLAAVFNPKASAKALVALDKV